MTNFDNTYILKLDIKEQMSNQQIRLVQNDTAYLKMELYDAGKKMDISAGDRFVVSTENEATGERNNGMAEYDGGQYVAYQFRHADMKSAGSHIARLSIYKNANRVSSLSFRYEVYEDLEYVGTPDETTMLGDLFTTIENLGIVAQRQGEYAEDRGDYANSAGDYANSSAESNKLNWLPYVKTVAERASRYPNPLNGDVVFVIDDNKVYRFDGIEAMDWEPIAGWDSTVIQNIYNTKEDKSVVQAIKADIDALNVGGRNLLGNTEFLSTFSPKSPTTDYNISTDTQAKRLVVTPVNSSAFYSLPLEKDIESGTNVNVSFYAKPLTTGGIFKIKVGNGTNVAQVDLGAATTSYKFFTVNLKTNHTSDGNTLYIQQTQGLDIRNDSFIVEQSSKPSAWRPSYTDILNRIQSINNSVADFKNTTQQTINTQGQRLTSVEQELNNNVVKKSMLTSTLEDQTKLIEQIKQTAEGITTEVSSKIDADEVKSIINQTSSSVKISARNIDFDGMAVFKNSNGVIDPNSFVSINNGELTIKGFYERIWRDGIKRNRIQSIQFVDGMMRMSDPQGDEIDKDKSASWQYWNDQESKLQRSLYYTSDGISTYKDGTGKYTTGDGSGTGNNVASGTIEFWSHEYSTTRGLTLYSANGAVGLQATNNSVVIHGSSNVYNRSKKGYIVLAPQEETRNGVNQFTYGVGSDLQGIMVYGDTTTNQGCGFKFSKSKDNPVIYGIDAAYGKSANVALNIGKVQADVITDRSGINSVYFNGSGTNNLSSKTALQADGIRTNSQNFYIGVEGELRVTNKNGYNSGKTIGYLPVKASKFNTVSSRKYKTNIEDLDIDSISILKDTEIKQYNLKTDLEAGIQKTKYGVILEDTNEVLHEGDAIDVYGMESIHWDASKKMLEMIEAQQKIIEDLQKQINELKK